MPAPVPRPLARLRGTLDELLADPALAAHEGAWVQATLTDPVRPRGAMDRLRRRFPHALVLGFESSGRTAALPPRPTSGRGAHDVTLDFVSFVRGTAADAAEAALLATACEACTGDREADPVEGPVEGPVGGPVEVAG
ncbi:exonuclease SbcCD subunit D C-terminal domain-containing protein [Nocardioides zeae]